LSDPATGSRTRVFPFLLISFAPSPAGTKNGRPCLYALLIPYLTLECPPLGEWASIGSKSLFFFVAHIADAGGLFSVLLSLSTTLSPEKHLTPIPDIASYYDRVFFYPFFCTLPPEDLIGTYGNTVRSRTLLFWHLLPVLCSLPIQPKRLSVVYSNPFIPLFTSQVWFQIITCYAPSSRFNLGFSA